MIKEVIFGTQDHIMHQRIYLIGFMGVGKTTLGRKLAVRLGYDFVDLDDFFEKKYKIEIHQFFEKYGEPLFRELENERLKKTFSMENVVVATGGGTPCYPGAMEEMNRHGLTVYLEMPPAALADRLLHAKRKRPLVEGKTGETLTRYIKEKLESRLECYNKAALKADALHLHLPGLTEKIKTTG
jgi:shikimate kinase